MQTIEAPWGYGTHQTSGSFLRRNTTGKVPWFPSHPTWGNVGRVAPVSHFHCYPHFPSQLAPPSRLGSFPADACISCTETCFMSAAGNDSGPPNMQLSIPNSETSIFPLLSASQRLKTACPKGKSVSRGSKVQSKRIEKISFHSLPVWLVQCRQNLQPCLGTKIGWPIIISGHKKKLWTPVSNGPFTKKPFLLSLDPTLRHRTQLWGTRSIHPIQALQMAENRKLIFTFTWAQLDASQPKEWIALAK